VTAALRFGFGIPGRLAIQRSAWLRSFEHHQSFRRVAPTLRPLSGPDFDAWCDRVREVPIHDRAYSNG
jgi:hypothetical protein